MKSKIIIIVVILLVLGFGGFAFFQSKITVNANEQTRPWIEVTADSVWTVDSSTGEPKEDLTNGDELANGDIIATNNSGSAIIHFPDSSVARLEPNSKITIEETNYDPDSGEMSVKLKITAGNLWSKIFDLASTSSTWQVESSNTVATVRGTAFGFSIESNSSWIIGSEHSVNVKPIDVASGNPVGDGIEVGQGKALTMADKDVALAKSDPNYLKTLLLDTPDQFKNAPWVLSNQSQDDYINSIRSDFEKRFTDKQEFRRELRKYWFDKFKNDLKKQHKYGKSKVYKYVMQLGEQISDTVNTNSGNTKPPSGGPNTPPITVPPSGATPVRISIFGYSNTDNIPPGTKLIFKAIVTYSDNTQKEVTNDSTWQADSAIGTVTGPGLLSTPTYSQYPSATGQIQATWKNPATGSLMIGKSTVQITFRGSQNQKP